MKARRDVDPAEPHRIEVHLDKLLAEHGMTLTELAERVGITIVNLSVLKNDRAKAIRFSTKHNPGSGPPDGGGLVNARRA